MARILIVEDSPDNMKLFTAVLGLAGHTTTGLADGRGLIEAIEASGAEMVLMDIQLPGCDGYALLEEIRAAGQAKIPVVALTAHAMEGDQERVLQAGFNGYITKPIDVRAFPAQIANLLRGRLGTELA